MDNKTSQQRSWNMSRIRSKNTKPEKLIRSFLHKNGFRFRLHVKTLPGHPDIVLPKFKTAIEVRGCFWHRHKGCKKATVPLSNVEFWTNKFLENEARDKRVANELKELGWNLIVIWECETAPKQFPPNQLLHFLLKHSSKFRNNQNINHTQITQK